MNPDKVSYLTTLQRNHETLRNLSPDAYPSLHKHLYQRSHYTLTRLEQFLEMNTTETLRHIDGSTEYYARIPIRKFAFKHGGQPPTWTRYIALWTAFGLIVKAKPYGMRKGKRGDIINSTSWYHIPSYTPELLREADNQAKAFMTSGITMKGVSKATLITVFGQGIADLAYQDDRRKSVSRKEAEYLLEVALINQLEAQGFAREWVACQSVKQGYGIDMAYLVAVWSGCFSVWAVRYDLKRGMPTKDERRHFRLKDRRHIIRPRESLQLKKHV